MKKITAYLFVLASLLFPTSAFAATLSLSPSTGTYNKGCDVTVDIKIDATGVQTDGVDSIVFYDPTRFNVKSIKNGTIFAEYPANNIDAANGKVVISGLASASTAFTGTGTLATLNMTVLATAPDGITQMKFDFDPNDKAKTNDSNIAQRGTVTDILSSVTDGTYTIGTGSCLAQGSTGTTATGSGSLNPIVTKTPVLPVAADYNTTVVIAAAGGLLTILGILGLAFL
jgi:hypothetical protein